MATEYVVPDFVTVTIGMATFILGARANSKIPFLQRYNIPEPVTGGLAVSVLLLLIYLLSGIEITFETETRDLLLVIFFAAIGLNARLSDLIAGGKPFVILAVLTVVTIVMQNLIGIAGAAAFGFPFQTGVLFGSAALIGGHGTAIAWAPEVARVTGLEGSAELGIAVATLGLVLAALVGGPIARYLIETNKLTPNRPDEVNTVGIHATEDPRSEAIDHLSIMRALLYLNVAIMVGYAAHQAIIATGFNLPLFVPCLIAGIVIANLRAWLFPNAQPVTQTPSLALLSEYSLGVFLAISLMSMQLWTLADLGFAILSILAVQTLFAVAFVIFVLFPAMGGGYRAAVLGAGFGGFALGATPTAIANMTAVTKHYGPSPIAFVVLPLVSAFLVDIANAIVIQTIVNF